MLPHAGVPMVIFIASPEMAVGVPGGECGKWWWVRDMPDRRGYLLS
jgi:hypothetical protein